jgi:DsrE/DsrF-like family
MNTQSKVVINLATGLEDPERVTVAFLVGGRMLVCPICFNARKLSQDNLIESAEIGGATPLWEWIGEGATVFSY